VETASFAGEETSIMGSGIGSRLGAGIGALFVSACAFEVAGEEDTPVLREELSAANAADRAALAYRWAPVHYQDVDQTGSHALGGRSDYVV
jgi:hypothetical protein